MLVLFVSLAPFRWVYATDPVRTLWMLPALIAAPVVLLAAARAGHRQARLLLAGVAILILAELGELARAYGAPFPGWLPVASFAVVLMSMALALAERFSHESGQMEVVRRDLERRLDQRTRALADVSRAAERSHRMQSEFLANMSHDLRTPLNSVIGFANVLLRQGTGLGERERGFLERIRASGEHLLDVVEDVLDLSRIESGRIQVRLEDTDVGDVTRAAAGALETAALTKALYLYVHVPTILRALPLDPERFGQVIENLIGNAIKFTEHGGVTVRVESESGRPRTVIVEDTGIGIPAHQIERIFEPFQQGDGGGTRHVQGSGLGLTIARTLCRMMGCELSVNSEPGIGSQFRVTLPATPARPRSAVLDATIAPALEEEEEGQLVLIIDDEPDARLLLEEHVRSFGMRAVSAESGLEGLRLARELKPDLVTLDLKMPGMDGWSTLRAFKADPGLRHIPVVVVSVIASEARGTFLGRMDLVGKPVDRNAIEAAVRHNLRGGSARALVVDDDPDARLLLTTLLETAVEEVRAAEDGVQALELLQHYDPSIILLDLVMPRMDGMTFLRKLREDPRHAHVPVLVVTSKELTEAETAVLEHVTAGVVRKGAPPGPGEGDDGSIRRRLAVFLETTGHAN